MQNATALVLSCTEKLVLRINVHTHARTHEIPVLPGDMRRFTERLWPLWPRSVVTPSVQVLTVSDTVTVGMQLTHHS